MLTTIFAASLAFAGTHFVVLPAGQAAHVRPYEPPPAVVVVPSPGIRPPHPPPPPVIYGPRPMEAERFAMLISAVDHEPFSDDKLDIIQSAARNELFTIAQLGRLMDELAFSSDRVEAARLLRPRIIDPENAWMLSEHLVFSSDKEAVQRLFR